MLQDFQPYYLQNQLRSHLLGSKYVSMAVLLIAICTFVGCIIEINSKYQLEYLLLAINSFLIMVLSLLGLYWSCAYNYVDADNKNNFENTIYVFTLLAQLTLAFEISLFISLLQFGIYKQQIWILLLMIPKVGLLLYLVYLAHIFNYQRLYGVQRMIIYIGTLVCLTFVFISSIYLKDIISILNLQVLKLENQQMVINLFEIIFIVMLIDLIALPLINFKRIRLYFATISLLIMFTIIMLALLNGNLVRDVKKIRKQSLSGSECRDILQSISRDYLKDIGCPKKYLNVEDTPYLSCPQTQQSYIWENKNEIACLNLDCCRPVEINILEPIMNFTTWNNLIVTLSIVLAFNAMVLAERAFYQISSVRINFTQDLIILCLIFFGVIMCVVLFQSKNFLKGVEIPVQNVLATQASQLDQIQIMRAPNYHKFDTQDKMIGYFVYENCELAQNLMTTQVPFKDQSQSAEMILALQGLAGKFLISYEFNTEFIKLVTTKEAIQLIFTEEIPKEFEHDELIIKGLPLQIQLFMEKNLYFCSKDPTASSFNIYVSGGSSRFRNLDADTEEAKPSPIDKIKYYNFDLYIEDLEDNTKLEGAQAFLYYGSFYTTSCQIITTLYPHFLDAKADKTGKATFWNLSYGYQYTILVKIKGYKHGCVSVDLAKQNPKLSQVIRLIKPFAQNSIKVLLDWSSPKSINLDLYGRIIGEAHLCMTGAISKECGGMKYKTVSGQYLESELIYIDQVQQEKYQFFVKRFLNTSEALKKLEDIEKPNNQLNSELYDSDPQVAVYVSELEYPMIQYHLPPLSYEYINLLEITWVVFEINGQIGDAPITNQTYYSSISNTEIKNKQVKGSPWPGI